MMFGDGTEAAILESPGQYEESWWGWTGERVGNDDCHAFQHLFHMDIWTPIHSGRASSDQPSEPATDKLAIERPAEPPAIKWRHHRPPQRSQVQGMGSPEAVQMHCHGGGASTPLPMVCLLECYQESTTP